MKKSLLLLSLFFSCAYTQTLSLEQSIEKTLLNNPDIQSFILKTELSQKNYDATFADNLPQINLQAEYDFAQTYTSSSNGIFYTTEQNGGYASAAKNLKNSLKGYKIKSLYKLIVVQKEAIEVNKKDLDSKKAYYEQAQGLVSQGFKTKADSSRFLSAVYFSEENLAIAQASFDKTKKSLSLYIGEKIKDDTTFESDIIKKNYSFEPDLVEEEILSNNSQLKINALNIDKNKLLYKSAKASHYGSIDGVASYNHFDTLNEYNTSTIGVTVVVPLYSGGRIEAETQKARINIQLAKQEQSSKILAIKESLSNLLIDIARYDKTIASKQAQLHWANDTKDVLEGRYKEGLSTYIEVLDAESLILTGQLELLEAYYTKSTSIDQVDYLKGKIQ